MFCSKIVMAALYITGRLADNLKVTNYRVLSLVVPQEFFFVHVPDIAVDSLYCFNNMGKIILDTKLVGSAHIG